MAEITLEEAKDLGKITLNSFKRDKFEVIFNHNDYPIVAKLYKGRDIEEQTGKLITRSITLGSTGNADHTGIFQEREQVITNIQEEVQVPFVHAETSLSYAVQEVMANGGSEGFVKLIKIRRTNMMNEFADELEGRAWKCPDSSSDKLNPCGIPYWITDSATTTGGWYGKNPNYNSSATEIAAGAGGIDSDVYADWANWYAGYSQVDDTLLKKLAQAFRRTKFRSPATVNDIKDSNNYQLYTNDSVLGELETFALKSDDAVGYDLGKYAGRTAFKRVPFDYHDILDTAGTYTYGTNPIFGINWDYFEVVILKGDRFRMSDPINDRKQHNVLSVFCDLSYNYICTNRKKAGFLLNYV